MSPDADILVFCVHHFEVMGKKELYIKREEKEYTLILLDIFLCTQFINPYLMIRETLCCKSTALLVVIHAAPFMALVRKQPSTS